MRAASPLLVLVLAAVLALAQPEQQAAAPTDATPTEQPPITDAAGTVGDLITPMGGTTGIQHPVAAVKATGGAVSTAFDLEAGKSLYLIGSESFWTSGWQYFRWEFKGCTPSLDVNWDTIKSDDKTWDNTFTAGLPTSSKAVTFNTKGLKAAAACRVDFVLVDNCELRALGVGGVSSRMAVYTSSA